jgi:hypothetical protein
MYGGYTDVATNSYKIAPPSYDGTDRDGYLKLDSATNIKDASDVNYKYKYDCSKVYPEYLAYLDAKEYIDNNETGPKNLHRCGWAKACSVPWTSAGCS